MRTLLIMMATIFFGLSPSWAESKAERIRVLKNKIESLLAEEMVKEGTLAPTETVLDAALFLVILDLKKGFPKTDRVLIQMLENENVK